MMSLLRFYDYLTVDIADARVKNWPLLAGMVPTFLIICAYLTTILVILPNFMKNRKAYNINKIVRCYNLIQIGACLFINYGMLTSGWLKPGFRWICEEIDYSDDPDAVRLLTCLYYTYLLKIFDMLETIFFLLRKKNSQVTNLHVYHHILTFVVGFTGVKYVGGGAATFQPMLNNFIHVFMYTYYYLSNLGPEWRKRLVPWKPRLTILQMVQFAVMIVHTCVVYWSGCKGPRFLFWIYTPNIFVLFYMFASFYYETYVKKGKVAAKSQ